MKVVIVGGVAGGASAAARLRRLDEQAEIIVFERSGYMSYANCGLPYYIGGAITDSNELTLQTPETFWERFHITVRVKHEVTHIDTARKTVRVLNLATKESFEESYDRLVLSPGARPTVPQLEGIDSEGIFTLRTVEDTMKLKKYVRKHKPTRAVVVGAGFIGIEMAENLAELGMDVAVVEFADQVLGIFDKDMANAVRAKLASKGVRVLLQKGVAAFAKTEDGIVTSLTDATRLTSDIVLLAMGVTPDTALAQDAGLKMGQWGSIVVNDRMQTSAPDVYAVGDAVEVEHRVTGRHMLISLAGPANKQGHIAADNICGLDKRFRGAQGSSVIKVFDMTAAATGINEKAAQAAGIDYDKVVLLSNSHATYYPGAKSMTLKVLFEKGTGRVLGAQIVGYDGVDKRIDVLATAIFTGVPASELQDLDLAYAPPYSSAKDPVNMAGYVIDNVQRGIVTQFHYDAVAGLPRDGSVTLLDVRTPKEFQRGHVSGFVNIPVDELRERMAEVPAGKPVYIMCHSGHRSYIASRILTQCGYTCHNFSGGYSYYKIAVLDAQAAEQTMPCGLQLK